MNSLVLVEQLRSSADRLIAAGRGVLLVPGGRYEERLASAQIELDSRVRELYRADPSPSARRSARHVELAASEYDAVIQHVLARRDQRMRVESLGASFEKEVVPIQRRLSRAVDEYLALEEASIESHLTEAHADAAFATSMSFLILAGAAGLTSLLAFFVGRRLIELYRREEVALQHATEATSARQALLATIAHDIRTPLAAITLRGALVSKLSTQDAVRSSGAIIESIASRTGNLLDRLLESTALDAGRLRIEMRPVAIGRILRHLGEVFELSASSRGIDFQLSTAPTLRVLLDRARTLQALENLVGNAMKFTPAGGTIRVCAEQSGGTVEIVVDDTGPGIPEEMLPTLFDAYAKGPGETRGVGLGLHIAKGIVEAQGGSIAVANRPDGGARFTVRFPALTSDPLPTHH